MGLIDSTMGIIEKNPVTSAVGAGVIGAGVVAGAIALSGTSSKKKAKRTRKKIKHTSRGWKLDRAKKSKQSWEVSYRRRKHKKSAKSRKNRKGIHYTKNGQPYKILSSGKARFIKKRKGGKK